MKNLIIISILFFFFVSVSLGQSLSLNAKLDTNVILVGDQIYFNLEVEKSNEFSVQFPILKDTLMGKIEILDSGKIDTSILNNQKTKYLRKYLVTSFDSGNFIIPSVAFLVSINGKTDTVKTTPLSLMVNFMPKDTAKTIHDIKPPLDIPITIKEIITYAVWGLLVLAIIALAIFIYYAKKKNKPLFVMQKPKVPAHLNALQELDKLKDEKLWQKNEFKHYHSRLTDIVRIYFEERFGFLAMEQTTDEILDAFKKSVIDTEIIEKLTYMLTLADLVKFAKTIPLPDENDKCMNIAYSIVLKYKSNEISDDIQPNTNDKKE